MSNNNLKPTTILFYFGTAILLSLLLVTSPINLATAQDDEDDDSSKEEDKEEEEESKDEEQDQEEEQSEADKTKELLEQEKKELEELEEQKEITEELNETTQEQQIIQQQLNDLLANNSSIDQILNNDNITLQPVVNTSQESSTVLEQPVAIEKQFNATCNCFANNVPATTTTTKTPTTVIPQQQQEQEGAGGEDQQIPITKANIKNSKSFGQVTDQGYTGFYTVSNLLDNTVNDISFWSQAGKSSFYIELDSVMDNYQVCSAELIAHNPKGTPYLLDVGVSKNYTGIIDQMNEQIKFDKCVKNMDEIFMMFDSPDNSYVSLAEIQFFGKKLGSDNNNPTPQPDPTIPKPQPAPYKNMTKINISNSEAEINIQNSTVTFRFDPQSAKATGYNIITIPNAEVVN